MDLRGLHGFNGSLLDPMKMTDAELLDTPDEDEDIVNKVGGLGSNSSGLQTPEKQIPDDRKNNGSEGSSTGSAVDAALVSSDADFSVDNTSDTLDKDKASFDAVATMEITAKNVEIQSLRETNSRLTVTNQELKNKVDLNEDELTDLREQFGAIEKDNEEKENKIKELSSVIESLQGASEKDEKIKALEDKIEKDKTDAMALQKRNQDAIGNKNQKIASLNEELSKLKEENALHGANVKKQEEELDTMRQENQNLSSTVANLTAKIEDTAAVANKDAEIGQLKEQITQLTTEHSQQIIVLKDSIETAEKNRNEVNDALNSLKTQHEEQKIEVLKLQADLKEANETVQDSQMAARVEKDKNAQLNAEFEQTKTAFAAEKEKAASDLQKTVEEKELITNELEKLKQAKSELDASAGDMAAVVEEKKHLSEKCNRLEMEAFELTRHCNELKILEPKVDELQGKLKEMDGVKEQLAKQKTELVSLRAETQTAKERNNNLLQSNEKLMQTAIESRTNHKNALDNLSRENTTLKKTVNDKEKALTEARRKIDDLEQNKSNEGAMAVQMIPQMQMAHNNEVQQLKRQIETLSGEVNAWQKWKQEDEKEKSRTNSQVESLTKVLVETKQEALTFKQDLDGKSNEIGNYKKKIAEVSQNLQIKINECEGLRAMERGNEKIKKDNDKLRSEAEAFRMEVAKYKAEAEKSDRSQKELTKEATKMFKMLQEKDELLAENDKKLVQLKKSEEQTKKEDLRKNDIDKKLQEAQKDYLILEKESQFQKKELEQARREVDFLKKENAKVDKELQKARKDKSHGSSDINIDELAKELSEAKRQLAESSTELNQLKRENATTSKRINELEKQNKKLGETNKQLNADLVDEKAKVMVLCELRDEEDAESLPPPPKRVRAPPKSDTIPVKPKGRQRPKSMPAKIVEDSDEDSDLVKKNVKEKVIAEAPEVKETEAQIKTTAKKGKKKVTAAAVGKLKKSPEQSGTSQQSTTTTTAKKKSVPAEPIVTLIPATRKRGRAEKDPVQEVMEYLARTEKRKGRSEALSKPLESDPKAVSKTKVIPVTKSADTKKAKDEKKVAQAEDETEEVVTDKKAKATKRKAEDEPAQQPVTKKGKMKVKIEETKAEESNKVKTNKKDSEPAVVTKAVAKTATKAAVPKAAAAGKKGVKVKDADSKKEDSAVLVQRKGKGIKAAAIIAAITDISDHETEASDSDPKKGKKKKPDKKIANVKKTATTSKKESAATKKTPPQKKLKRR